MAVTRDCHRPSDGSDICDGQEVWAGHQVSAWEEEMAAPEIGDGHELCAAYEVSAAGN